MPKIGKYIDAAHKAMYIGVGIEDEAHEKRVERVGKKFLSKGKKDSSKGKSADSFDSI